jgi:hypothetical protein
MESHNALSVFSAMPENKAQIESFIRSAKEEILSGQYNPIKVEIQLKIMEELIAGLRKDAEIRNQLLTELDKYTEKTIAIYGSEITKSNRTTFDYSTCNDTKLQDLMATVDHYNAKVKQRQEMLKNIEQMTAVDPDTGEYLQPPTKKTTEIVSIKIK